MFVPIYDPVRKHWLFMAYSTKTGRITIINSCKKLQANVDDEPHLWQYDQPAPLLFYSGPFAEFLSYLGTTYDKNRKTLVKTVFHADVIQ